MANRDSIEGLRSGISGRLAREVERERHERALHDEARAGLGADDCRTKDARERNDTGTLRRHPGR